MSFNDVKVVITVGDTEGKAKIECDGIDIFLVHNKKRIMILDHDLYEMIVERIRIINDKHHCHSSHLAELTELQPMKKELLKSQCKHESDGNRYNQEFVDSAYPTCDFKCKKCGEFY